MSISMLCFFFLMTRRPPRSTLTYTLFPYTTPFLSCRPATRTTPHPIPHHAGEPSVARHANSATLGPMLSDDLHHSPKVRAIQRQHRREDHRRHRTGSAPTAERQRRTSKPNHPAWRVESRLPRTSRWNPTDPAKAPAQKTFAPQPEKH